VNGIENYSIYFDKRNPGEPPYTIFDYFPDDMLMIFDESHMSVPQLRAMPQADRSRKESLVNHGFRLPSARDHRPLGWNELEMKLGRKHYENLQLQAKSDTKSLFVSATPGPFELELSDHVAEQIIRPTGLLDPITTIYPKSGDYSILMDSISRLLHKKPHMNKYLDTFDKHIPFEEIFHGKVEENQDNT
jgi:excinuclease ABC subunit B